MLFHQATDLPPRWNGPSEFHWAGGVTRKSTGFYSINVTTHVVRLKVFRLKGKEDCFFMDEAVTIIGAPCVLLSVLC